MVHFNFRCPLKCSVNVNENIGKNIFEKFYKLNTKDEQDIYLQGLIEVRNVQQKRKRNAEGKDRSRSYWHFLSTGSQRIKVCQNTFCSVHAISVDRLKRIKKLLVNNETPQDKRGKHPKGNAISDDVMNLLKMHINSYPVKHSHYSGNEYHYLDARLNIKIMYDMFRTKHPDVKITYHYFLKFFHENFTLHFGRPQVDTCNKCEEYTLKIKSNILGDAAKRTAVAEKIIHKRRAKKFYNVLRSSGEECKQRDDLGALAFDYMQNLQLPLIPVQDLFYMTQLAVSVFCIHDMKTDKSYYYVYSENTAAKSPNEVCSFLMNFIENYVPEKITELRLFSDNCPGQNKNHCVVRFCMALVETGRFKKLEQFFPIRGHSFLPCDRDFGIIKRNLRKHDRIYDLHQYTEIIISASVKRRFTVHEIRTDEILDFKSWWPAYYKKDSSSEETQHSSRQEKVTFTISKFHHIIHDSSKPGYIKCSEFINGLIWHSFRLVHAKRTKNIKVKLPEACAYAGNLPVLASKIEHLKVLLQWVEEDFKPFYEAIINSENTKESKIRKIGKK